MLVGAGKILASLLGETPGLAQGLQALDAKPAAWVARFRPMLLADALHAAIEAQDAKGALAVALRTVGTPEEWAAVREAFAARFVLQQQADRAASSRARSLLKPTT